MMMSATTTLMMIMRNPNSRCNSYFPSMKSKQSFTHLSPKLNFVHFQTQHNKRSGQPQIITNFPKFYSTEGGDKIAFSFIEKDGSKIDVSASEGETLLEIAHKNKVDLEGACEGSLACSTCHVILTPDIYQSLPEPSDEENDMLDLAFGLTSTSRLGCQVKVTKDMQNMEVRLPSATRNMAVDGFKPKPH